jgi:hypothetical protein
LYRIEAIGGKAGVGADDDKMPAWNGVAEVFMMAFKS